MSLAASEDAPSTRMAYHVSNEELYALLSAISDQVAELSTRITALQESHTEIRDLVVKYGAEVKPVLDSLASSPIARMFGVK